jgi:hypothetical protein
VIDVCVGVESLPPQVTRILPEIRFHVFVHFFLKIDAERTVNANNFVGANTGIGRNIAARIRDANVRRIVADGMVGALLGGGRQSLQKCLLRGHRNNGALASA